MSHLTTIRSLLVARGERPVRPVHIVDLIDAIGETADGVDLTAHIADADPHVGYVLESLIDAKGDLIVGTAADTPGRLAVGVTNGHALVVDSAETTGLKWAAAGGSVTATSAALAFTDGDTFKRFTIADAAVTSTSKIVGSITRPTVTDANDLGWTYLHTIVSRGAGTFDLLVSVFDWNSPAEAEGPIETVTFNYVLGG